MGGIRPSGLNVNKPVVFGIIILSLVIFLVYRNFFVSPMAAESSLRSENLQPVPLLKENELDRKSEDVEIEFGDKKSKVHVEQVIKKTITSKPKLNVLFLHGNQFSSKNWLEIKTTDHVANWGHAAIAIDLPGKGQTPVTELQPEEFLHAVISKLQMSNIVIIAPSMSGSYALPYLLNDPSKVSSLVKGFVPVAPVGTRLFESKFSESQIPTLIVYGSNDKNISSFLPNLEKFPKHTIAEIKDAGHACYLDKPDEFHKALYTFLQDLKP